MFFILIVYKVPNGIIELYETVFVALCSLYFFLDQVIFEL